MKEFELIKAEKRGSKNNVGFVLLNSPRTLNALSDALINEINEALDSFDNDPDIGCSVITGKGKAFAG